MTDTTLRVDLDALAELLPCPFCGGTNISLREDARANMAWCTCVSCGLDAPTETGVTKEQAVEYWNRRAALPSEKTEPVAELHRKEGLGPFVRYLPAAWKLGPGYFPLYASPSPAGMKVTDAMVEAASRELLLHRGFEPSKIKRSGMALWEENAPAMRAALTAALDPGEPK